ncbi:tRNA 2-thiouridine(34) synthase MnmA [Malaciobacter molluscorum LMG 25693]|uniref:tRNA-specific 2-thiouridylase MnmA n=1 Tax=Malaciobacter molluscorum LMG 25693 TaxID=870501 RepID=A0A2G1DFF3_9BACT|nr:tRNA 2-thiouridine(34) synthase MnmA [Malaciobacter molluscorum]AXX91542.1 tRNA U34 2-thiouridylase [Malaciobacter molluscorum LMG 25693]PHO17180.1 tRNA 2-thiouridine(34) synthase MnmA [Malaciobacter molluscorum LMG 25693]
MKKKVVVGMSGGVDSSVTALLLKQQGYDVQGLFMRNWEYGIEGSQCPNRIEFEDAKKVGKLIGIEVKGKDFVEEYRTKVFDVFLEGLKKGLTPNPDILCNREIKFNVFLNEAKKMGADFIATGHYAKIAQYKDHYVLDTPKDNTKDQSYFLHALSSEQLSQAMFPLADLTKKEVRQIAKEHNLPVSDKKDSTGICFIGKQKFDEFITQYLKAIPGDIIDEHGKVIGKHKGLVCYTLGQRKGIGLGGIKETELENNIHKPWYVAKKDMTNNTLTIVQDTNHPLLMSKNVEASHMHWVLETPPKIGDKLMAQVRYRQQKQACTVVEVNDEKVIVEFDNLQRAVTLGQSLVLYDGNYCLGGGFISDYN